MKTLTRKSVSLLLCAGLAFSGFSSASAAEQRNNNGNHRTTTGTSGNNHRGQTGNTSNRPAGGNTAPSRPGNNSTVRPGNNNPGRPGNNSTVRPGNNNPGRPGTGSVNRPPHSGYNPGHGPAPTYRPPYHNRWERPLPPRPVRYNYVVRPHIPVINSVFGLTFGSYINNGIAALINAGFQIASAVNDAIFLNNVAMYGYNWPEATIYYGANGMNGARLQYGAYSPEMARYNSVYRTLVNTYGAPVSSQTVNGITTSTWWGGSGTGYVTLQYGPSYNRNGNLMYYTDLIYGN